jgi:hypothetical protein
LNIIPGAYPRAANTDVDHLSALPAGQNNEIPDVIGSVQKDGNPAEEIRESISGGKSANRCHKTCRSQQWAEIKGPDPQQNIAASNDKQ